MSLHSPGYPDPLANLIDRLVARLAGRMNADIDRGGSADGEGWRIERSHLLLGPSQEQAIPLADIVAVEVFEQKMCIWRQGQDAAIFKAPLGSRNAHLLPLLLAARIPSPDQQKESPSSTGLGRILFERRPQAIGVAHAEFRAAVAAVGGIILLKANRNKMEGSLGIARVSLLFVIAAIAAIHGLPLPRAGCSRPAAGEKLRRMPDCSPTRRPSIN
jgi:hypothetical protein